MTKERIIICDFDGTLITGNLEQAFMNYLLSQNDIRFKLMFIAIFTLPINLTLDMLGLPSIFKSWTFVLGNKTNEYIYQISLNRKTIILS